MRHLVLQILLAAIGALVVGTALNIALGGCSNPDLTTVELIVRMFNDD